MRIDSARDLEEEVAQEKQRPDQRGHALGDTQILFDTCSTGEAIVGAVQISEAVGDENEWYEI
ncbi:hypothetical protein D9M68_843790 [compost metagenome]